MENALKVDPKVERMSKELLHSLITEFQTSKWEPSHAGIVAEVRKGPDFNKNGERLYVIKYADGYVYMLGREADPAWAKEPEGSLIGREVRFKVMSVETPVIYVSHMMCTDMYRLACQKGVTMTGTIMSAYWDKDEPKKSFFVVMAYGDTMTMPVKESTIYTTPTFLPLLVKDKVKFKVKEVTDKGEIIVSKAMVEAEQRDNVLQEVRNLPDGFMATITKVTDSSAYMTYKGVVMIMRNRDFSKDYTPINMVKHRGDSILVKVVEVSRTKRIFVAPVTKYKAPVKDVLNAFQPGMIVKGVVTGVSSFGLFVRIAPGVDLLCSVPHSFEPERGDTVEARILAVNDRHDAHHRFKMKGYITHMLMKQGVPVSSDENKEAKDIGKGEHK